MTVDHASRLSLLRVVQVSRKKLVQQQGEGNTVDGGTNIVEKLSNFGAVIVARGCTMRLALRSSCADWARFNCD